ncbi:hypothetical protein ACVW1C_005710 [Bradyrhizobium sp. USDA 4011]
MKARIPTTVFLLLATTATAFAQNLPLLSTWKNDGGSILTIWSTSGDTFRGSFTNFAPGFKCQGIPYPAEGSVKSNGAVFLTVTFTDCSTVTNWRGRLVGDQIPTRWKLIYSDSEKFHTMYGKNVFIRQ